MSWPSRSPNDAGPMTESRGEQALAESVHQRPSRSSRWPPALVRYEITICPPFARWYSPASTNQPLGSTAQYTGQDTASAIAVKKSRVFALPVQALAAVSAGVGLGVEDGL